MNHPTADHIECYVLKTFEDPTREIPQGLVELEAHVFWCQTCLPAMIDSEEYVSAMRGAAMRLRSTQGESTDQVSRVRAFSARHSNS